MSEEILNPKFTAETQRQRWMKYGANVALAVVIVLVLAVVLIVIGQRTNHAFDTTADRAYSLKPQTLNILKGLDSKEQIRLVSLYTHPQTPGKEATDYAGVVSDLLDEYKHASKNIDVDVIDPITEPGKVKDLIKEVSTKYGGEVKRYSDFLDKTPADFDVLRNFAKSESTKLATVQYDPMKEDGVDGLLAQVSGTLADWPDRLDKAAKDIDTARKQEVPDYKGAADELNREMSRGADIADQVVQQFTAVLADSKLSATLTPPEKQYMAEAIPRFNAMKKQADAVSDEFKKLGALKLDEVTEKLNERDAILVLGPHDMRSLSSDQVWQVDTDKSAYQGTTGDVKLKPKFAGEQQITSAILSLTSAKKPKVVFLRAGGPPMTSPGFPPFQPSGPFSKVADRLRQSNFEVLEKICPASTPCRRRPRASRLLLIRQTTRSRMRYGS
jgi:polyhydroxyalkanoate synthesis regulator phasin